MKATKMTGGMYHPGINHKDPDHPSRMPALYQKNPDLQFVITNRGAGVLKSFCSIDKNVHTGNAPPGPLLLRRYLSSGQAGRQGTVWRL